MDCHVKTNIGDDSLIYLSDEEVELLARIVKNKMYYNDKVYKIVKVTNEGYYIVEITK